MSRSGSIPKGGGSRTFQAGLKVIVERTKSQHDKFKEAARELGCDEDPAHFDEALKKVARHKPPKDREDGSPKSEAKPSKEGR